MLQLCLRDLPRRAPQFVAALLACTALFVAAFAPAHAASPPVITQQPVSQTINLGDVARFTAQATGDPFPTIQWETAAASTGPWSAIPNANNGFYDVPGLNTLDGTWYRAVFSNSAGSTATNPVLLTIVSTAPVISQQPADTTVNAGDFAIFNADASGSPPPFAVWQFSTDNGVTWQVFDDTNNPRQIGFNTQPSDNGKQFRAIFTNSQGSATTRVATVTVNFAPSITLQPASQAALLGQQVVFTAAADGRPAPTAQWQLSTDNGATWADIPSAVGNSFGLIVEPINDGYQFRAIYTNSVGSATTNAALLTILAAPTITRQPADTTVNAGDLAVFKADASGNPPPTAVWQFSTDNGVTWQVFDDTNNLRQISFNALPSDNGKQFRAIFSNSQGSATTRVATATVNFAPIITLQPASQNSLPDQQVIFTAAANGHPTPVAQWQLSTDSGASWTNIPTAVGNSFGLFVEPVNDGNQFRAVYSNTLGSATTNAATLTIGAAPAITTQPASINVNVGQQAAFTAAAQGLPAPTVQWQVSTDAGATWGNLAGATAPALSFTVQPADNGNQYRAVFTNKIGSATSNAATLTLNTLPIITAQPANLVVNPGQQASFSAAAQGQPTPTVQWQVSTDFGVTWANVPDATAPALVFTAQAGANGNLYRAVFTNAAGSSTTNGAQLLVAGLPRITTQPANQAVNAGALVTFGAAAIGSPAFTVQWQVSADNGGAWNNLPGATATPLSFTAQASDNGKQYRAVFTNVLGASTTNAARLTVTVPPTPNVPPTLAVARGGACLGDTVAQGTLNLTVGDVNDGPARLSLRLLSTSNPALVPASGVTFGGSGAVRTVTVAAAPARTGSAGLILGVSDGVFTTSLAVTVFVGGPGGSKQADPLIGTAGADLLFGLNGASTLSGLGGNDLLCGGNGPDTLDGGPGDDALFGGRGPDTLTGGRGADFFSGGQGKDKATDFTPADSDTQDGTVER